MQITNHPTQTYTRVKEPSFAGTIKLVSRNGFDWLRFHGIQDCFIVSGGDIPKFNMTEAAFKKPAALTRKAFNCVAGSIFNPDTKLTNMFHLNPYKPNIEKLSEIQDAIFNQAEALFKESNTRLEGFLGATDGLGEGMSEQSRKLFGAIKVTFDKIADNFGMDYSMIAQRKNCGAGISIISDARINTHYICAETTKSHVQNLNDLMDNFYTRILSPKDNIIIGDKDVSEEFRKHPFMLLQA
ncbi:MAG: hypothetical protein WCF95_02890 [bacterium]